MTDREFVEQKWNRPFVRNAEFGSTRFIVVAWDGKKQVRVGVKDRSTPDDAWSAARAYTEDLLEQIRQAERGVENIQYAIDCIVWHFLCPPDCIEIWPECSGENARDAVTWHRILAREQATLDALKIGLKEKP